MLVVYSLMNTPAPPAALPRGNATQIAKVSWTHEDMIDFILLNPGVTDVEIGRRYGYSGAWVCTVRNSDAFRARVAARRLEVVDPVLQTTVNERLVGMTDRAIQRMAEKLDSPAGVTDALVAKAVELGIRGMGLGGYRPPDTPDGATTDDRLERLATRLIDLQARIHGVPSNGQIVEEVRPALEG